MTSETDTEFVAWARDRYGSLTGRERDRLFALARRGAVVQDRIEQLEVALRHAEAECEALMELPEEKTPEDLTGYSRGSYFTAKHLKAKIRAALEASDE